MPLAEYTAHGAVAVITMNNPPVNGLSHALRTEIVAGVFKAGQDPAINAIVLIGGGNQFCGGADIREFNTPKMLAAPMTRDVISALEDSAKPVVAAIHGVAMGGGLEVAMGCHYRVALASAQIALPEVKLGLLPGAGGTQRLPRAIGAEKALEMIVSGDAVRADRMPPGLIDRIIEGDLATGAIAFANEIAPRRPTRLRDRQVQAGAEIFAAARKKASTEQRGFAAPARCIDAVEAAATFAFDEGLKLERAAFLELVEGTQSKALRHAFFAERAATKIPDVPENTPTIDIQTVGIIGAGTMCGGIAMTFVNAGIPVKLLETSRENLDRGLATIKKNYASAVARGRLTQDTMDKRMALIAPTLDYHDIRFVDLVIEAVFERMDVKETVFKKLEQTVKPGTILATNTSTLDVNRIAAATGHAEWVLGMHFFSPANVMRLLEVVRGAKTSKQVLATVMKLSRRIGKVGVVAGVTDGFIGNRMLEEYIRQSLFLLDEGALPQQVDRALYDWGMAMGPFAMYDLAGGDIGYEVRKRRRVEHADEIYSPIADRLVEAGRLGQKTGKGYYKYEAGSRTALPDPEVERMIVEYSKEAGVIRRPITDREIVERTIFALVNEGAKILEEGIALRASDIDTVYLTGYGFPRYRGGPMYYADTVGLKHVVERIGEYAKGRFGERWEPAPLLKKLAAEGKTFNEPNKNP